MNFNIKSKKGFTLIELLVVIGILAVLAAIAIPSVAGLIDRANVSADATNATEMTNAVERFVSEYELYKQDIASGVLDTSDLNGAQGRVYNVTKITKREDVTKFESTGFKGRGINIDTKYPANEETLKAVIQNYTKTSSSTFEPKQSDKQFYYSPEVGGVIVGETGATISELNDIYFAGSDDATADGNINWICLDDAVDNVATDTKNVSETLNTGISPIVVKTMKINSTSYNFEEGMTWGEWCSSKYNVDEWYMDSNDRIRSKDGSKKIVLSCSSVKQKITYFSELNQNIMYMSSDTTCYGETVIHSLTYNTVSTTAGPTIFWDLESALSNAQSKGYVQFNKQIIFLQ